MYSSAYVWAKVLGHMESRLTPQVVSTWFDDTEILELTDEKLVLYSPSSFRKDIILRRCVGYIKEAMQEIFQLNVDVVVLDDTEIEAYRGKSQKPEFIEFNPQFTFDNFVVGSSNRFAHAAALAVAEQPGMAYNPLFLYGGVGLGKTHLMHAIGHFIQDHFPNMRMLYLPSEMFTNELVAAIKNNKNVEFRNRFRNVDVLMLDDIQFIAGRDSTQEEFFHTFNALHSAGKQIIISSDKPPREIARLEERLRSRFEWGLIADIQKPDFDTRIAILRKKAENEGIEISDEMLELIAGRIESNIRELEGSLTRVNAYAKLNHCEINEEVISHALHDIAVVRDPKRITPELIIDCVADYYSLSADMLRGDSRKKEIALARHVAVYLTREMTGLSLPRIGDAFGRDHSTIINSCDKVTKMLDTSSDMKSSIADLKKIITEK